MMNEHTPNVSIMSFSDFYEEDIIQYVPVQKHFLDEENTDEKMTDNERFFLESYQGDVIKEKRQDFIVLSNYSFMLPTDFPPKRTWASCYFEEYEVLVPDDNDFDALTKAFESLLEGGVQ